MVSEDVRALLSAGILVLVSGLFGITSGDPDPAIYDTWETFTKEDGLPDEHIYSVRVDGDRVWAGTDDGLACYEDGAWRVYKPEDGLAHRAVMAIDVDKKTGDLWIGTFGGLNRFSAGRFDTFTQFNSGLANDIVYGVAVQGDTVWAATTAGTSSLDTRTGQWRIFTERNAPMHEIWCYNVTANDGKVYVAAWGGGVLEYDVGKDDWEDYRDPDGEMEIDLLRNDGLVHDVTTAVSYEDGLLWATTYFGMSVYDGRHWKSYMDHDSGLASNFVNFVRAQPQSHIGWICTDKGLSVLDYDGDTWVTYRRNENGQGGEIKIYQGGQEIETRGSKTSIAHNFVLSIDFQGDDVWVGTSKGLSHGRSVGSKE